MKNPLRQLYVEICKTFFRCPYSRKCKHYNRETCYQAWIMGGCGKYKKYEQEEGARATQLMEEQKRKQHKS